MVYVVRDDDYGTMKLFKCKSKAVDYMYNQCKIWGALLFAPPEKRFGNLININTAFPEEDSRMIYLYERREDELNYIFTDYFTYYECTFEDEKDIENVD